jgi:ergothioneine biosynthesis protein EgtB
VSGHDSGARGPLSFIGYEGGTIEIGQDTAQGEFAFDNEGPRHRVLLGDFELASRPIDNHDVMTFIEAGGYDDPLLWLSDGWAFKNEQRLDCPLYWVTGEDGALAQFTHHGLIPLDLAETACHLTYFEVDAIARFYGARLPTEQEWECAASRQDHAKQPLDPSYLRPGLASAKEPGRLSQMMGGVWEWTQSPYVAYPGFVPPRGAVGEYNGKFMHNQMVLRGGSCATPTNHARISYRNFFPSGAQWQFSGARLAKGNHRP